MHAQAVQLARPPEWASYGLPRDRKGSHAFVDLVGGHLLLRAFPLLVLITLPLILISPRSLLNLCGRKLIKLTLLGKDCIPPTGKELSL